MRLPWLFACSLLVIVFTAGCAAHRAARSRPTSLAPTIAAPAVVVDNIRESLPGDYLRISFVSAGVQVTSISRPGSLRGFATATAQYQPPLALRNFPAYSGLIYDDKKVLVAMRCRPPDPVKVDALLATWPNIFLAIEHDMPDQGHDCASPQPNLPAKAACFAKSFDAPADTSATRSLAHAFDFAERLDQPENADLRKWLQSNYGIYPAFSGTGYSVKDSYTLDQQPMNSNQVLAKSVSSEYILKNVPLGTAGCRCITVPAYSGRAEDILDPDQIDTQGGDGICRTLDRLPAKPR